jgi:hypothetical protein
MPETPTGVLTNNLKSILMELKLTTTESEKFFYNAMCNGLGFVLSVYDLELHYNADEYALARESLAIKDDVICFEDVLMQMLRMGYKLTIKDIGCDGEFDCTIGLDDVHSRVQMAPIKHLMDMANMRDDGDTADAILQHVFYGTYIFG